MYCSTVDEESLELANESDDASGDDELLEGSTCTSLSRGGENNVTFFVTGRPLFLSDDDDVYSSACDV
jgi:hypothetical protein